jgi:nucleotide-binding universal stress UspA family protein
VQIKPILARLQSALGRNDLIQQMVLLPETNKPNRKAKSGKTVKLVVGYNGSPHSQTALDVTLWIAYQTRMATQKQVVVHVVYVVDADSPATLRPLISHLPVFDAATLGCVGKGFFGADPVASPIEADSVQRGKPKRLSPATAVLNQPRLPALPTSLRLVDPECMIPNFQPMDALEHADYVLWQARCLAEEWRGSLEAHLCFGNVAAELRRVVESEAADLLLLGCTTTSHPLVRQLAARFPCPILGIPHQLNCSEEAAVCS